METLIFWLALFIIIIAYMTMWYLIALYSKRYDTVDSAWGLGFVVVAWVSLAIRANFATLQVVSAGLVTLWGLRLFAHIAARNWRKSEDDHRYQALRQKWETTAARRMYTNVFLLQGLLVLTISTPLIALAFTHELPTFLTWIGWAVWLLGITFEALADRQLAQFIRHRQSAGQIMQRGLWRYSRHPNYFGEIAAWWGAAIVASSVGAWWGIVGAATITVLITKISGIPLLEKHYQGNQAYAAYRRQTSVLVPMRPKPPTS